MEVGQHKVSKYDHFWLKIEKTRCNAKLEAYSGKDWFRRSRASCFPVFLALF